jgi:hypothetical protein
MTTDTTDLGAGDILGQHGRVQHGEYDPVSGRWTYAAAEPGPDDGEEVTTDTET